MLSVLLAAIQQRLAGRPPLASLLSYQTTKRVVIKDPVVGSMRLIAIFAVFSYLCIVRIMFDKAYFKLEPMTSVIQSSLHAPAELPAASSLGYCAGGREDALRVLPCVTLPAAWVASPTAGGNEVFIATRLKEQNATGVAQRMFVTAPESHTVGVTFVLEALGHLGETGTSKFTRTTEQMQTRLLDIKGAVVPGAISRVSRFDVFEVGTLLRAAGVESLEDAHDGDSSASFRYDGLVVQLTVDCPMERSGAINRCDYKALRIQKAPAEAMSVYRGTDGSMLTQERRGIKLVITVHGSIGVFDMPTFLLTWVSSLACVELVAVCIDFLLSYILPYKAVYRMVMFEESPDFSGLRARSPKAQVCVERWRGRDEYLKAVDAGKEGQADAAEAVEEGGTPWQHRCSSTSAASSAPGVAPWGASVSTPPSAAKSGSRPQDPRATATASEVAGDTACASMAPRSPGCRALPRAAAPAPVVLAQQSCGKAASQDVREERFDTSASASRPPRGPAAAGSHHGCMRAAAQASPEVGCFGAWCSANPSSASRTPSRARRPPGPGAARPGARRSARAISPGVASRGGLGCERAVVFSVAAMPPHGHFAQRPT